MKISTKAELQAAVAKFNPETSPFGDVLTIQKAAADLNAEDELPASGPLAKAKPDPEIAKMQTELAILKLSPEARTHHDALDEAGKTAFLAKSAEDQTKEVEAANATDPVVYKCKDGSVIRKSDGAVAASQAKRLDDQADELAKLRGDLSGSTIEKQAGEKFPHVAKAVAVDMLKSAHQLGEDTEAGKAILASLASMEKAQTGAFKGIGSTEPDGATGDIKKARSDYNAAVAKIAERDKCDIPAAMSKARAENPELFAQAYPETVAAAEDSAEQARQHQSAE